MSNIRFFAEQMLLRGLTWVSAQNTTIPKNRDLYWTKIFGGPLRGMFFSVPHLERAAFALGTYERHVVEAITTFVKPNAVAYDIGANAGYLTLVMAKLVGKQGQVFAFEPDPKNLKALEENIRMNGLPQVTPIGKAVSHVSGTVKFASFQYSLVGHIAGETNPSDAQLFEVSATCLDDFVFAENHPKPVFIKIDVEGAEEQVLLGGKQVLQEVQPVILAEVRGGQTWAHISELMKQHNYTHQFLSGGWDMGTDGLGDVLFVPGGSSR